MTDLALLFREALRESLIEHCDGGDLSGDGRGQIEELPVLLRRLDENGSLLPHEVKRIWGPPFPLVCPVDQRRWVTQVEVPDPPMVLFREHLFADPCFFVEYRPRPPLIGVLFGEH